MDKYEFNIKVEQIKKLVTKGDYETSMKIADSIDWRRVRNANLLAMISQVYEKNGEYQEAKEVLLLAFERAPIAKRLLYKLTELALKEGSVQEAEDYYREFCDMAPDDSRQHLLRYMILKEKGASNEQLIHSLERYTSTELDEKWMYELASLYAACGMQEECVSLCDRIMLMFGIGKYVDKAMELKVQFAPLNRYQMDLVENRDKYEAKLKAVEQEYGEPQDDLFADEQAEEADEEPKAEAPEETADGEPEEEPEEAEAAPEPAEKRTLDEELAASLHQAEAEKQLAEEMSRISVEDCQDPEPEAEATKQLKDLKHIKPVTQMAAAAMEVSADASEEEEEDPEEKPAMSNHLLIESRTPETGLQMAVDALKKIHQENHTNHQVVKISGSRLNKRGLLNVADKLAGKDLIIEEAGDLSEDSLKDLQNLMDVDRTGMAVVLIDNPRQIENLHSQHPDLAERFECIGSEDREADGIEQAVQKQIEAEERIARAAEAPQAIPVVSDKDKTAVIETQGAQESGDEEEEMDLEEFAEYACQYASDIDCSITGKSKLALYERIEIMEEDGIPLTKANAEELIEEAADKAEKPPLGRRITGMFSSKYDKDGLLILKEEHFI